MKNELKRYFYAVPLSGTAFLQYITSLLRPLKSQLLDVQWQPTDNYHITIYYFGKMDLKLINILHKRVIQFVNQKPYSLTFNLDRIDVFQSNHTLPLVIKLNNCPNLISINSEISRLVKEHLHDSASLVITPPFSPHITLGRIDRAGWLKYQERIQTIVLNNMTRFSTNNLNLMYYEDKTQRYASELVINVS